MAATITRNRGRSANIDPASQPDMQSAVRRGARVSRKPAIIVHPSIAKVPREGKNARRRETWLSHDPGMALDILDKDMGDRWPGNVKHR